MQTSLESPWIQIPVNPFLRAYFIPNIIARYSAALFVAIPTPSRNLQIFKVKIVKRDYSCTPMMTKTETSIVYQTSIISS